MTSDSVSSLPGFSATYLGESLSRLKATKILIWNSGSDIIESNDFASTSPLALEFPTDAVVLDAKLSGYSNDTNQVEVSINPNKSNEIFVVFEYLGKAEGLVISALHTAQVGEPKVIGIIKGSGSPVPFGGRKWANNVLQVLFSIVAAGSAGVIQITNFSAWWLVVPIVFGLVFFAIQFLEKLVKKKSQPKLDAIFDGAFESKDFG